MRLKRKLTALHWIFLVLFACASCGKEQPPPKQPAPAPQPAKSAVAEVKYTDAELDARAAEDYKEFDARVKEYAKLHNSLKGSLPRLGRKETPEKITEHEMGLAQKLREARANAKQGDLFTPEVSAQIKRILRNELTKGPKAPVVRKTIQEGEPLKDIRLSVGLSYPEKLPMTTMPPSLLLKLPKLPKEMAYRIIGHDLVLHDTVANIVVDFIPEAMP